MLQSSDKLSEVSSHSWLSGKKLESLQSFDALQSSSCSFNYGNLRSIFNFFLSNGCHSSVTLVLVASVKSIFPT